MPSSSPNELGTIIHQLEQNISQENHKTSVSLLSKAKLALLHANGLAPNPASKPELLVAGQHVLELGALTSIRLRDPLAFTRYFQQLRPFYSLPNTQSHKQSQRSKVTGLYLLLLLSQGDYAGFHTQLESLEMAAGQSGARGLEDDEFVQYPMRLEQWLMEGSYDRVWEETKSERVPSEEFAMFSEILVRTIQSEIASCSEKAYPSIPVTNAKNLLFLESEGSVIAFSQQRGWEAKDGRVYFPAVDGAMNENDILATSGQVIENTLGYARELETIV